MCVKKDGRFRSKVPERAEGGGNGRGRGPSGNEN